MTPPVGELRYTEVEEDLRASVRSLLDKHCAPDAVLARTESAEPVDTELWRALAADVGCAGLAVPERLGGAGASWREAAVVAEETGRAVAPVPLLGAAVATALLLHTGDETVLPAVAAGERTAVLAVPFTTAPHAAQPVLERRGDAAHGTVAGVADATVADTILVPAGNGPDAVLLAVDAADLTRTPVGSLDMTRPLADLTVDGAPGRVLARGDEVAAAVRHALLVGAALLAGEQLGAAERCLALTVEYLSTRRQFGRILGSYQALKHRLADLWVSITQARAAARYAADCAAGDAADLPVAAAVAQAHCSAVATLAAQECLQLHGGIGFTWEYPAHLYLKRATSAELALGSPDQHRLALASLLDIHQDAVGEPSQG